MSVSILDCGVGNLRSLQNALRYLNTEVRIVRKPEELHLDEKLILPGVGHFGYAMRNLQKSGLHELIVKVADSGTPILGICLGMQLFSSASEEEAGCSGLGLIKGFVKKFQGDLKVPHMGWNEIKFIRQSRLARALPVSRYAYFVHSFYCQPELDHTIVAQSDYGGSFAAIVEQENIFGLQFHPEKSQDLGLQILKNFVEL